MIPVCVSPFIWSRKDRTLEDFHSLYIAYEAFDIYECSKQLDPLTDATWVFFSTINGKIGGLAFVVDRFAMERFRQGLNLALRRGALNFTF